MIRTRNTQKYAQRAQMVNTISVKIYEKICDYLRDIGMKE